MIYGPQDKTPNFNTGVDWDAKVVGLRARCASSAGHGRCQCGTWLGRAL